MTPLPSLTVEEVPIDLLRPDPANPRRISDEELDALERSLRQFGFVQPVLARKEDGAVIGGHQRLVAARRLGLTTVPVTYLDLSIEQARLLNLGLNKISGSWDEQLLARLLADLQASPRRTVGPRTLATLAILSRQIPQRCCTCRNNPHPRTRICLRPVAGPKDHLVCLQECSCIQMGYCHSSQFRPPFHSSLMFHLSSCATFQIVFPHCGMNLDGRRRCLEIGRQASVPYRFW